MKTRNVDLATIAKTKEKAFLFQLIFILFQVNNFLMVLVLVNHNNHYL